MFVLRGPVRTPRSGDDLVPQYAGARAWLHGQDPYARSSLSQVLLETRRETNEGGEPIFNWSLYPPGTFVMLAPLALPSWPAARVLFLVLTLGLIALHLRSLLRLAALRWPEDVAAIWLIGMVVALAPYHTGIALAQMAIPSVALVVIALERLEASRATSAGTLLGLAMLCKPQLAAPFVLYAALRRQGRAAWMAVGVFTIAMVIGVLWLEVHDVPWWQSWNHERRDVSVAGGHHDPTGPWSAQLVELRPLIGLALGREFAGPVGFAIAAVAGSWVYLVGRNLDRRHDLLLVSGVAVLTLLSTYHRFYDAALLCLPLAWAASTLRHEAGLRREAIITIACCAVFFAPGAWMLQRFANEGLIPAGIVDGWFWNGVLLRHQNWTLVALCVCLLRAIAVVRATPSPAFTAPRVSIATAS